MNQYSMKARLDYSSAFSGFIPNISVHLQKVVKQRFVTLSCLRNGETADPLR
jgi:hypothetical protein